MNEIFEVMRFGGGETEWEEERGGRGGGGRGAGSGRGRRPPPGRGANMGRGPRRPRSYPMSGSGPFWSYPQTYPVPYPEPYPAQYPQAPDGEPREPDDGVDSEVPPPKFTAAVARLPAAQRPRYIAVGTLETAPNLRSLARPGLYLIVFPGRGGSIKAYHGQTDNVGKRLGQHRLCARMLDVDPRTHLVYMAATPTGTGPEHQRRRQIEIEIHRLLLPPPIGQGRGAPLLTNQRLEFEQELPGQAWR